MYNSDPILGHFCTAARASHPKVYLAVFLRILICLPVWALFIIHNTWAETIIIIGISLVPIVLPLRHLGDTISIYENGFLWNGKSYLKEDLGGFQCVRPHPWCWIGRIYLNTSRGSLNVTYVKNPMDAILHLQQNQKEMRNY